MNIREFVKKNTMVIALVLVAVFFSITTKGALLSPQNITNLISQNSYVVILAVGMLFCILTGGNIDLSVGSIVALVGAVAGTLIVNKGMNMWLSIIICLLIGLAIGAWQGFWIAYVRIPPFIVTLAGMMIWRGIALIILDGMTISPFPDQYNHLFNEYVPNPFLAVVAGVVICIGFIIYSVMSRNGKLAKGYVVESLTSMIVKIVAVIVVVMTFSYSLSKYKGIPYILILLAVIVSIYAYYSSKTVSGRYYYAVGGNEKAAKLSGVNTNKVLFTAYINVAFLSAVAALVCVARFNSAAPTAGTSYELDAIGSCFIGGASAYGGIGTIPGVVIGAIFMGVINNGMSIMGLDSNIQKTVKGFVLLAAVIFDVLSKQRNKSV